MLDLVIRPLIDGLIHANVASHHLVLALAFGHAEDVSLRIELNSNLGTVVREDAAVGNLARRDHADMVRRQGLADGAAIEEVHIRVLECASHLLGLQPLYAQPVERLDQLHAADLLRGDDPAEIHGFHLRYDRLDEGVDDLAQLRECQAPHDRLAEAHPGSLERAKSHVTFDAVERHRHLSLDVLAVSLGYSLAIDPYVPGFRERTPRRNLMDIRADQRHHPIPDNAWLLNNLKDGVALVFPLWTRKLDLHVGLLHFRHPSDAQTDVAQAVPQMVRIGGKLIFPSLGYLYPGSICFAHFDLLMLRPRRTQLRWLERDLELEPSHTSQFLLY